EREVPDADDEDDEEQDQAPADRGAGAAADRAQADREPADHDDRQTDEADAAHIDDVRDEPLAVACETESGRRTRHRIWDLPTARRHTAPPRKSGPGPGLRPPDRSYQSPSPIEGPPGRQPTHRPAGASRAGWQPHGRARARTR